MHGAASKWIDCATRHPLWFATLVQLRALQARIDDLSVGAHQSPRPIRETHFAGAAVLQSTSPLPDTFPRGTPMPGILVCSANLIA